MNDKENEIVEKTQTLDINREENDISDVPVFDPNLKKKKKKSRQKDNLSAISSSVQTNDNDNNLKGDSEEQKKESEVVEEDDSNTDLLLSLKKKKKKPKKKVNFEVSESIDGSTDYSKEEIKSDGNNHPIENNNSYNYVSVEENNYNQDTSAENSYMQLLDRFYQILELNNPDLFGEKKKHALPPPLVSKDGPKKTVFENISQICSRINRNMDHVIQFLLAELGTSGSVDGTQRLVIKGRFVPKQIENLIRKYIYDYVTCKTCKTLNTQLNKENRIFFINCMMCGSQRSVGTIKSGFKASLKKDKAAAQ